MTPPLESTWATRDLPVLGECLRRIDTGEVLPSLHDIQEAVGIDQEQMRAAIEALESASPPYNELEGHFLRSVRERARRELGTWPTAEGLVDRLAAALTEAANAEEEPERKGKARAAADAIGGYMRDLSIQVLGTQIGVAGPL